MSDSILGGLIGWAITIFVLIITFDITMWLYEVGNTIIPFEQWKIVFIFVIRAILKFIKALTDDKK